MQDLLTLIGEDSDLITSGCEMKLENRVESISSPLGLPFGPSFIQSQFNLRTQSSEG